MKLLWKLGIVLALGGAFPSYAELQTTLSLTAPVLSPGTQGTFTASQVTGPAASATGTLVNPYGNVLQYVLSPGTGRFASISGTRYGVQFDTFQIFQSFLNPNFFSMLSSGTTCPSATNYTWLLFRWRSPDAPRQPMNASSTSTRVGGTLSYNPTSTPVFQSSNSFDLVGPNTYSTSYSFDSSAYGACSNGDILLAAASAPPLDAYGQVFFGQTFGIYVGEGGNPAMATLMPQQTLSSSTMTSLSHYVLSGVFTGFASKTSQTQQYVYVVPNAAGTTFTLNTQTNPANPTQYTNYGTLTCTNLNSPMNGFCSGTLSLVGMAGTSNAICQLGSTSSQNVLSCTFDIPNQPTAGGSLIATNFSNSLLSVTVPTTAPLVSPGNSGTVVATIQNLTGTYIPTMGNPSGGTLQLTAPFSDPGAFAGTGGTCGATLAGYASCTVNLSYAPTSVGTTMEVFRVAYNNQVSTVNGTTSLIGASGLTSLSITPNSSYFAQGGSQQFTATATYSDGSTQDVSNAVIWGSSASSVASMSTSGLANFLATGTTSITASLASVSTSFHTTVYIPPPNPSGLTAVSTSYTQITLNWTSGGGSTNAFQISYQTGATAPADCNSGTVISSGVVGNVSSYAVTGLQPQTQYTFRVCAANSTAGALSSGITATQSTKTPHVAFATAGTYSGNMGGLYFSDYICQTEATAAGWTGTWKAILSDGATNASGRITLSQSVYNLQPLLSGGWQLVTTQAAGLFAGFTHAIDFSASGGTPGSGNVWTGTQTTGALYSGRVCNSWTSVSGSYSGEEGLNTSLTGSAYQNGNPSCAQLNTLYCINLQTSAVAPPNPTGFSALVTGSNYIQFGWNSGGGTTAAYQMSYQTGATAPASCSAGTIISPATLGLNPTNYSATGLSTSTQYSFRLCAENSDLTAASSGVTLTVTTTSSGTVTNLGSRQIVFSTTGTYYGSFGGLYYGDFICQQEASNAGLSGTWKFMGADDSNSATGRITIAGTLYNNRPSSSGGYQEIAPDSSSFWSGNILYPMNYNAGGTASGSNTNWTGCSAAGASTVGDTCTSWTTSNSGVRGTYGNDNGTGGEMSTGNNPCNNLYSLACTNQQTSAAAPPNPTGFSNPITGSNYVQLSWASGGGTTAAYQMSYTIGATAPATCSTGSVISAATLGVNPTSYTITGLSPSTQYTVLLCAENSDLTAASSGVPLTFTTPASGTLTNLGSRQVIFATTGTYYGSFGGLYYGDYVCQQEANNAGMVGTWKFVGSDNSNAASARILMPGAIYNNRPSASGGYQQVAPNSSSFWSSSFAYTTNYNASGGTPGSANVWTGTSTSGATATGALSTGYTCNSWTTSSSGSTGEDGNDTATGNAIATGTPTCNNLYSLYCTNQQASSSTPPDATGFTNSTTSSTSIQFSWTPSAGTTAAFQIAYQTGATAPANCSSGTVIPAASLGLNPSSYTVTGLTASTQYSFLLCAANSDLSSFSPGVSLTVTTTASGTIINLGTRQVVFATQNTYRGSFGGLYFGDFACQMEANNIGLNGNWMMVGGDDVTSAISRISIPGAVYNNRPSASGGYQMVAANSSSFWSNTFPYSMNFNASGGTPGAVNCWTGTLSTGALNAGNTCSSWTSSASSSPGEQGQNNTTGTELANSAPGCNNTYSLYCTSQQAISASTPPNPTNFLNSVTSTTSIQFTWTSGGSNTSAYQLAYQAGASAPANCNSGTVISAATLGVNPTTYTVTGLTASTQYSFLLCSANSNLSVFSSGTALTVITTASGSITNLGSQQIVFSTNSTRNASFGGLYYGDFVCQQEASNAGLNGTWKMVGGDNTTSAISRINIPGAVYNNRPSSAGGYQQVSANSASFWGSSFLFQMYYNASGGNPGSGNNWTGTLATGALDSGVTCSSWTTSSSSSTGMQGQSNTTGNELANSTPTCNNNYSLYCTNQQNSSATPPNPTNFLNAVTSSTSIQFSWSSGGGTTAAYQMAYQAGSSVPASCSAGTVFSAATLGVNPTNFTVTGLSPSTQYSFLLCAENSDLTAASSGVSLTVTTTSSGSVTNLGSRQVIFATNGTHYGNFGGLYFGDYACQTEASNAGLNGTWKMVGGDDSNTAIGRITIPGAVYNNRPSSSGGYQLVAANSASFWSSTFAYTIYYNASGGSPGSGASWTGTLATGALDSGSTCSSWTTSSSSSSGVYGSSNNTGNDLSNGTQTCNNLYSLYCVNQQNSSATPPNPTGFTDSTVSSTSIQFSWASGGGSTAAYQMSYQAGATAPTSCSSGTVITPATLGLNPVGYTLSGLTASTQYSFRLCAENSDLSASSSGVTLTVTTTASGTITNLGSRQVVFSTATTYLGNFGGLYYGDFACQLEANNAGLAGVWKAVLSDNSTSAVSRISIPGAVYNNRPAGSGGYQQVAANSSSFWSSTMGYSLNYNALGTTPGNTYSWTGSTTAGAVIASTNCNSWTTAGNAIGGEYGYNAGTGNDIQNGVPGCNNAYSLYCTNQQTASAAPNDPATFASYSIGPTSVGFAWSSGGGTTAAFQLAYQTGSSAPANCNTGTIVSAATLGVNPLSYVVTGLNPSTQYSFRLCAENSDLSQASAGKTATVTTLASGSSPITNFGGSTQVVFQTTNIYLATFGGLYWADFICQLEATNAGLSGTWLAMLSDDSTNASSRVTISGNIFNNRPLASGGIQFLANGSTNFWTSIFPPNLHYSASGGTPVNVYAWTGSNFNGTSKTGTTCSSWTTSSGNGEYGVASDSQSTGLFDNGNTACTNNVLGLYCTNQQPSASTPPNPSGFTNTAVTSGSATFTWSSGGTPTAAFQLAYQTGSSAPANCNSGTVISASTLGVNPTSYTVTGLTSGTQYSFRLCAYNSDLSASSSGVTLTKTTTGLTTPANQTMFSTANTYRATFGGLYFADFICQQEAIAGNLAGTWKAVMSDDTTSAASRISLASVIYNNNTGGPAAQFSTSSTFWSGAWSKTVNYSPSGGSPGSVANWTGSLSSGSIDTGRTCSSWTNNLNTNVAEYGNSNGTSSANDFAVGTTGCNGSFSLYCINEQSSAAAPSNPSSFSAYETTSSTIGLLWSWSGSSGTTGGYQISYTTGATAPASCTAGTVIGAATVGTGNPTTYTVQGLSSNTQYSFRLCAVNSDLSAMSSGTTLTVNTASSGSTFNLGTTQYAFTTAEVFYGDLGNIYFADFICQNESITAGLSGTWKAVLSDTVNGISAASRLTLSGSIYNLRAPGSGGAQIASNSTNFFNNLFYNTVYYTAAGNSPSTNILWTGSTNAGGLGSNSCLAWASSNPSQSGEYGNSNSTTNVLASGTTGCNTARALLCLNQQTSAAAPSEVASVAAPTIGPTSIGLVWSSGGGTTAAFKIAYQTGATAPATCSLGTVIPATSIGYNPTTYTVTGLTASTQYSFRICAQNSDLSSTSNGITITATTPSSSSPTVITPGSVQMLFSTANLYYGSFGGIYFGDFACQLEANSAGLSGVWKSVTGDDATAPSSHIATINPIIYNMRPNNQGGIQQLTNATGFWGGPWSYNTNYAAAGGAAGSVRVWTGSNSTGTLNTGNTCSSWTSALNTASGADGWGTTPSTGTYNGTSTCNNTGSLFCINQQASTATTPNNPTGFTDYSLAPTAVGLVWTSGGGTTAAYQIAYQTGATAPATCNTGITISAATLGVNPTGYTVSGLTASTQYSFRLCAEVSDLSLASSGVTLTVTTLAAGSSTIYPSTTQQVFATQATYNGSFGGIYFADYGCQLEAGNAGFTGTWKAVIGDESNAANAHISLGTAIYNNRPSSSGGIQLINNGSSFWAGPWNATAGYTANGSTPPTQREWTGTTNTGGINTGLTCSSWTNANSGSSAEVGYPTNPANGTTLGTNTCNTANGFYCINQQASSSAPPNPTGFTDYSLSPTSVGLIWTSGGGTTAAYQIAFQTGSSAPANCNTGTVITASTLGVNPSTYAVTGLTAGTQYSFLLCAYNSDLTSASSGTALTLTTPGSGSNTTYPSSTQQVFATQNTYYGNFGGIHYADYACQLEALNAGFSGTWLAVIGDETNAASGRITLSSAIYNNRPVSSGGIQLINDGSSFWGGPWSNTTGYTATGSTPPTQREWTGTLATGGINSGLTCSSWTNGVNTANGAAGYPGNPGNGTYVANNSCNTLNGFFCINQQTSAATPPNPTGFTDYSLSPTAVGLVWTSGGGTTAAFQLAYQTGATPPANCNSGTVITAAALGINPGSYAVSGLSASTQYSFLLCAYNSDLSSASSGASLTLTTPSTSSPTTYPSTTQQIFATQNTYYGDFGGVNFADYACQLEAVNAGFTGTWKALIGDDSNAASGRINVGTAIYNNRPASSGGIQLLSDGSGFWGGPWSATFSYNASGSAPSTQREWTGTAYSGAANPGNTCSSWSTAVSTGNGLTANPTTASTATYNANTSCNNASGFLCMNQQTSSAAPPVPATFSIYSVGPTSVGLNWTTGGGSTAAYTLAYQTGGTAPATCNSGTVISAATLGVNPTSYAVSGLNPSTQYSFLLCAYNSDLTQSSAGLAATTTTLTAGSQQSYTLGSLQLLFTTATTYLGNFGGIYYADFVCQNEANASNFTGTWKAVIGDSVNAPSGHVTLSSQIYNNRPGSSGGIQFLSNGTNEFWGGPWWNNANYSGVGGAPGNVRTWTGTTNVGASSATTCTNWTYGASTTNGTVAQSTTPANGADLGAAGCNNLYSFYCMNQQTSSAAPPTPTSFTIYEVGSNSVGFTWSSGGGTTAAFQLAYQVGTAPSSCNSGTVISAATMGVNPNTWTVTGLSPSTQYGFLLCAYNSDLTAASTGTSLTVTTTASATSFYLGSNQFIFATTGTYYGDFGGAFFGDYICQNEANNAGLPGTWMSILSDGSNNATRVNLTGNLYNLRPASAGGAQFVTNSNSFWNGGNFYNQINYNASGTTPGSIWTWTGSTVAGVASTNTCSSWTSNLATLDGTLGRDTTTTASIISNNTTTCNTNRSLFCINQQNSSATPPDVSNFSTYEVGATYVGFTWASSGSTTAAYQLSYLSGASAPSTCSLGTIITPATMGVNPSSYTVTGLTANTQYSFRLCAANSDLTSFSSGVTATVTTSASGISFNPLSGNQFIFSTASAYAANFGGLPFADFICQNEATNAGLTGGTWKAIMGDNATPATSHISLSTNIYNMNPASSGGSQYVSGSGFFWNGIVNYLLNYTASGGAPANTRVWTGTAAQGALNNGNTCSSWTTTSAASNGGYALDNSNATYVYNGTAGCNNLYSLLCTNQQTPWAAPPDAVTFTTGTVTATTVPLNWTSGGSSTAAYQIAYQVGTTAPNSCTTGTVITAAQLGINPTSYTVTGLTGGIQYSFRLCAFNSDLSLSSAGKTLSALLP